jgi:hypothetical protein
LEIVNVLVSEVEQETGDGCCLSNWDEYCVDHHEEELLEQVVSMSDRLVLNFFIIGSPIH